MYSDDRDIDRAKDRHERDFERSRKVFPGVIVSIAGSTTYDNLGPNFTWVKVWGRDESAIPAFNPTTLKEANTPVLIARYPKGPYRWEILSPNHNYLIETESIELSRITIGPHGENHQVPTEAAPGPDPTYTFQAALMPLKTVGDGATLTVKTYSYIYMKGGARKYFAGIDTDLTSSVPGAGLKRKVLLYLNKDSNLLVVLDGTTISSGSPLPAPEPAAPSGVTVRESVFVDLVNGQTAITTAADIDDCRDFLDGDDEDTSLDNPTAQGQVLVASEALLPIWVTPVIDENGYWMSGDDDQLVWE